MGQNSVFKLEGADGIYRIEIQSADDCHRFDGKPSAPETVGESVFTLDSDHSSFLSCPDRLADILLGIADLTGRSDAAGASAMLPRAPRPAASEGIPS